MKGEDYWTLIFIPDSMAFLVTDDYIKHIRKYHRHFFRCNYCNLKSNINASLDVKKHLSTHGLGDFKCLYCSFETHSLLRIRTHLADAHPNKLMFVLIRKYSLDLDMNAMNVRANKYFSVFAKLELIFTVFVLDWSFQHKFTDNC